jgi:UDP-glucose 4-epimerase
MNVLVTGGAGYVGTELVLKLAENPIVSKITTYL